MRDGLYFDSPPVASVFFGAGRLQNASEDVARSVGGHASIVVVADAFLMTLGPGPSLVALLRDAGAHVGVFDAIAGDPSETEVDAIVELARAIGATAVVAIGGGAALDAAKLAACVAAEPYKARDYALSARPLPENRLKIVCIPTTAGTGSEATRTSIVSSAAGEKLWHWGQALQPDCAILDPELTLTLPPHLTAWTGLDAMVHALEASTTRQRSPSSTLYGHAALKILAEHLPTAVAQPENLAARAQVLWAATIAGRALNIGSTAIAHCLSHAMASLAPIHHGFATALAQEVVLSWQIEAEMTLSDEPNELDRPFEAAATACGTRLDAFSDWFSDFLTRCGCERRLPTAFSGVAVGDLTREMTSPANGVMLAQTLRPTTDDDVLMLSETVLALAA